MMRHSGRVRSPFVSAQQEELSVAHHATRAVTAPGTRKNDGVTHVLPFETREKTGGKEERKRATDVAGGE